MAKRFKGDWLYQVRFVVQDGTSKTYLHSEYVALGYSQSHYRKRLKEIACCLGRSSL